MSKMFRLTKTKNYFCFENFCISMISITQITVIMLKGKNYTFYCQSILCHQTYFISVCMYLLTDTLFTNCQQFILNHSIKHEKSDLGPNHFQSRKRLQTQRCPLVRLFVTLFHSFILFSSIDFSSLLSQLLRLFVLFIICFNLEQEMN